MTLAKWEDPLHKLLIANGYEPSGMYGAFKAADATKVADREFEKYKSRVEWNRKTSIAPSPTR
jgi:hypothetical protein